MEITDKDYKRYKKMALVITNENEYLAGEILQELLIKIIEKLIKVPTFVVTDSYIFISLKNTFINVIKKKNNYIDNIDDEQISEDNDEYDYDRDKETTNKINIINKKVETFDYYDKTLYYLHFIEGKGQREISRGSTIPLTIIHNRINKIKNKLKNNE